MVTATTNFSSAVLNLQQIWMADREYRAICQESRRFYQEQKTKSLQVFSKYEYIFSENYLRLTESGSLSSYPDVPHVQVNLIFLDGVMSGQSYQDTYREIAREFDQMIREASYDPTLSDRLITSYEKELIQVYNDFGTGCVDIIRENFGNPAETSIQIDKFQTKLMKSVRKMLKKQVPRFWQQGIDWAEINLENAKKKEEYKKPDIYIPPNQDAVDALIERNLGFIKGMSEDQKKAILSELTEGMLRGEGIDQLVKRLAPYVDAGSGKGQSRAEMIARSEVMYGLNQGTLTRYKRDNISKVQWLAGPDDRMCPICGEKNGSIYDIEKAPSLPYHPNCRCCWTPYFGSNEDWKQEFYDTYGNDAIEHNSIYKDGKLITVTDGDEHSCPLPNGVDLKGTDLIHNHPTSGPGLSADDIIIAIQQDLKSMTAVSRDGKRHTIERPENGWPKLNMSDITRTYDETLKEMKDFGYVDEFKKKVISGELTSDEANARLADMLAKESLLKLGIKNKYG